MLSVEFGTDRELRHQLLRALTRARAAPSVGPDATSAPSHWREWPTSPVLTVTFPDISLITACSLGGAVFPQAFDFPSKLSTIAVFQVPS